MSGGAFQLGGGAAWISRSGYTGEDGFEISVPATASLPSPISCSSNRK
jgi:aminomethyltransferase